MDSVLIGGGIYKLSEFGLFPRTYFSGAEYILYRIIENEGPVDSDREDNPDGELISFIWLDADDRVEAVGEIETCVDLNRYAATIGSLSAVVTKGCSGNKTAHWLEFEETQKQEQLHHMATHGTFCFYDVFPIYLI